MRGFHMFFALFFGLILAGEAAGAEHVVKPGDSVARIADFYGVSQDDLRAENRLGRDEAVRVGQTLAIPEALRGDAARSHVVGQGDTLASVAKKYRVSVKSLAAANKIYDRGPLRRGRTLIIPDDSDSGEAAYRPRKISGLVKSGTVVPGGVRHAVQPGQSLWMIARAYNVKGERIAKANGFAPGAPLSVGREILIPGAREVVPVRVDGFMVQPVRFVRVWNNRSAKLRLVTNGGKINKRSRAVLSQLAGPKRKKGGRAILLHPRLIHMLQRVAERYPGRTIEIVSGVRPKKRGEPASKHTVGRAVDFRVQGVPRAELYGFVRQLPKTGAGFYPNSVFVHMDVRDQGATWTDLSGPGEQARYLTPKEKWSPESEADALEQGEAKIAESEADARALDDEAKAIQEE